MSTIAYLITDDPPKLSSVKPPTPATGCTLEYLDEGGANFVFRISPLSDEVLHPSLQGKLLRLRKDLAHLKSTSEQLAAYQQNLQPLFPDEHLIEHQLIRLDDELPTLLNTALRQVARPSHRLPDTLLLNEPDGLLITDMTPQPGEVLLQLKPKWLAQSPTAPPDSIRCRTCALRAQRASQGSCTATDAQASCPLYLVSDAKADRDRAAHSVSADVELRAYLTEQAQPLLRMLNEYQQRFDAQGCLNASEAASVTDLCRAMTLRDCTLFVKRSGNRVEARLGDLDLKQLEKLSKWITIERRLISEGWYANVETQQVWKREDVCRLARQSNH